MLCNQLNALHFIELCKYIFLLDNLRVVNYYFCDVCHYCFEAESLPDRCPDCGKTVYQNRPAIRLATEKEMQDLLRARDEEWE